MQGSGFIARAHGRRSAWRWGVSAVAVLCLLGQTSALVHRVLVQHATCAEHGESVHVAAVANASASLGLVRAGAEQPVLGAAAIEEADQHEHCAAADTRSSTPRLLPDQSEERVPIRTFALPSREAAPGTAVASYLIAPKTSPPRTAS